MSYVDSAGLDIVDTITEARIDAGLKVQQCIELCDITERTWYRWLQEGAPRWAIRLVMSQRGTLDHLGWKDWEISGGVLYYKQLSYRYHWEPINLVLPLYNIRESGAHWNEATDNLSSIEQARKARNNINSPESPVNPQLPAKPRSA